VESGALKQNKIVYLIKIKVIIKKS
jgi:hypothetical protein